ncbi:ParB N-terminal domain-containing protein [Agromyces sp. ISL-38]|uniref:ParB N-terminal domain-containing protein n=1 Tax=Agromyces sp. ISL-38 TaxID=2819107 RepID=UPI001BEB1145|nr:ParB N-terminal domain-containing protein [Agromyces sp. ISL-38]MBT2498542.1 ParB N-terminal domain-containing protein [Agromyces sp. ISL-38]
MTTSQGHIELERALDSIRVGARHRTDFGDIDALAASIERQGLLQPITVTPDGDLVCGARRLAALRQLGVRTVNVWVRSGISDELARLLAEQDDNTLHKPLAPTESAALYREVKALLAEEAQRRQEASRFQRGTNGAGSDGAASDAAPLARGAGDSRTQAAMLVTGKRSYDTLERIGRLQRIVDDEDATESLRSSAATALTAIDGGATVKPAFRTLSAQYSVEDLERLAADAAEAASARTSAAASAAHLHAVESTVSAEELQQLAIEALARAKAAPKSKRSRSASSRTGSADTLPVRAFVFQWTDLHEWWLRYDREEIAAELSDEQWAQFEATVTGSVEFADAVRELRTTSRAVAR